MCPRPAATATGLCDTTQTFPPETATSHGEPIDGIQRRTPAFQGGDDFSGDFIDMIAGVVEFEVGHRPAGLRIGSRSAGRRS